MTSIRPSMPGIQQTGPLQNVQRAAPPPKTEAAPKEAPKPEASTIAKDENQTKTFDDTPIADVTIDGLFDSSETQETDETDETDDTDAPDDVGGADATDSADDTDDVDDDVDVDAPDDVEGPEEPEEPEVEEEEEEEGGPDWDDAEGGGEGPEEHEKHINIEPLLELVAQLREIQKFRIEETWQVYGG